MTDYWELVCASPAGGVESVVNEKSSVDAQLDNRHLMLRGDMVSHMKGRQTFSGHTHIIRLMCIIDMIFKSVDFTSCGHVKEQSFIKPV